MSKPKISKLALPDTTRDKNLEIPDKLSKLLSDASRKALLELISGVGETRSIPPLSENKKIIIIDDEPKNLISQLVFLVCLGVHPENICLFCLNKDVKAYEVVQDAIVEFFNLLSIGFGDRLELRDGQHNQAVSCFQKISDLVDKVKEYRDQKIDLQILLDMQMPALDIAEMSFFDIAGACIIESLFKNKLIGSAVDGIKITITSGEDIDKMFVKNRQAVPQIVIDDKILSISVDKSAKQVTFFDDDRKPYVLHKNSHNKLEAISYRVLKVIMDKLQDETCLQNQSNIAHPNMLALAQFLKYEVGVSTLLSPVQMTPTPRVENAAGNKSGNLSPAISASRMCEKLAVSNIK